MSMKLCSVAALLAAGLFTGVVQANTVTINSPGFPGGPANETVTCTPSCEGLLGTKPPAEGLAGSGTWSGTNADVFSMAANASPTAELAQLNSILGLSGANAISGAVRFNNEASSFTGMVYEYWAIKKGTLIAFFKNDGNVPVDFRWDGEDWSHVTGFGAVVPIPAAAWLFGSALLGIAGIGYRKNAKKA